MYEKNYLSSSISEDYHLSSNPRMERIFLSPASPFPNIHPQLSIQPFPYIYVKYVKSHCVQVCRCINNSPPSSSFCSLHLISPTLATLPFSLLHPHTFSCCINTPPALMKVRIPFLCRSSSLLPVLSQLGEKGVRREEKGVWLSIFIHISYLELKMTL